MSTAVQERAEMQRKAKEVKRQREARRSFSGFVRYVNPGLLEYEHVPRLVDAAERVARGEIKRLLVMMPPRYFKSEVFSRLLPAYYLHAYPQGKVGLASYSAELAWKLSDNARTNFREVGGETASDTDAKKLWKSTSGGQMWAAGVGGSITGSGFDLGIIDDPMKPKHARSQAYIDAWQEFYPGTWYNRQEPGAAMIVVMQRLGTNDPIDFLYRREVGDKAEEAPEHWHVVCCDEIKSTKPLADYAGPQGLPSTCTLESDPREEGEILSPSRFDRIEVAKQQAAAGSRARPAQRQQRPQDTEGALWSDELIQDVRVPEHPALQRIVVAIDPAASNKADSDETGIVVAGRGIDGHGYVLSDRSGKYTPNGWGEKACFLYEKYEADRVIGEVNNGGDMVESTLRTVNDLVSYKEVRATRGKEVRAEPIQSLYEQKKVHHVGSFDELEDQMTTWDPASGDSPDRVDALVWALTELMLGKQTEDWSKAEGFYG